LKSDAGQCFHGNEIFHKHTVGTDHRRRFYHLPRHHNRVACYNKVTGDCLYIVTFTSKFVLSVSLAIHFLSKMEGGHLIATLDISADLGATPLKFPSTDISPR